MRFPLMLLISLALYSSAFCQTKNNEVLEKQITAMYIEDQKWRVESRNLQNGKTSAFDEATIDKNMGKTDSLNMITAKAIINKYGFPGYALVGEDGSSRFWQCDCGEGFRWTGPGCVWNDNRKLLF